MFRIFCQAAATALALFLSAGLSFGGSTFTLGSTRDEVRRTQGTPDDIKRYPALGYESWTYGYSRVKLSTSTGRVIEWNNSGNLKVTLRPGNNATTATAFTRGSHKDDVLRLQGTPDDVKRYPALGYERWTYGYSRVTISLYNNTVAAYSDHGNLRTIRAASEEIHINYHHTVGNLTLYYDENKSYSNIYSFADEDLGTVYGIVEDGVSYFYDKSFQPLDVYAYLTDDSSISVGTIKGSRSNTWLSSFSTRLSSISISGDINATGTAMSLGDFTFYDLMSDSGESVHGSSVDFDTLSFDNFYSSTGVSLSGNRIHLGDFSFGNWLSSEGTSLTGNSMQLGGFLFHNYTSSDGTLITGTTMEIGDFSFTNLSDW